MNYRVQFYDCWGALGLFCAKVRVEGSVSALLGVEISTEGVEKSGLRVKYPHKGRPRIHQLIDHEALILFKPLKDAKQIEFPPQGIQFYNVEGSIKEMSDKFSSRHS
jgi:hypothetical protein